jgi:hypothetical protein
MKQEEGKRKSVGAQDTRQTSESLADHLIGILSNPDTPAEIYNALSEEVLMISDQTRAGVLDPEVLRVAMPLMLARMKEQDARQTGDAAAASTAPEKGTVKHWKFRPVTPERAVELVRRITFARDDSINEAVIELVGGIATKLEDVNVYYAALMAMQEAFKFTEKRNNAFGEYVTEELGIADYF